MRPLFSVRRRIAVVECTNANPPGRSSRRARFRALSQDRSQDRRRACELMERQPAQRPASARGLALIQPRVPQLQFRFFPIERVEWVLAELLLALAPRSGRLDS